MLLTLSVVIMTRILIATITAAIRIAIVVGRITTALIKMLRIRAVRLIITIMDTRSTSSTNFSDS